MRTYKVGICDMDLDYISSLMNYVNERENEGIKMVAFTGMDAVRDYLEVQELDLIVSSDISVCKETENGFWFMDIRVIPLTETTSGLTRAVGGWQVDTGSIPAIFKYQKAVIKARIATIKPILGTLVQAERAY